MTSPRLIERLRAEGFLRPQAVVEEAKRAGLRLPLACALLEKESGKGRNVFGHDPTIFVGAGEVSRAKYREYKKRRVASGNKLMQGVGPCQLTWWEFQDAADREGGCWRAEVNMRVGFRHLVALVNQHGESDGARRYNGSGAAAEAYSRDLLAKAKVWDAKLAGHAVPAAPAGPRLVRRGDSGELVERITQRLSVVRSRRTGQPYLDGVRRRFDAEAEAALKEFQRDHRLDADGVFGARSARALNRAVELERERRTRERAKPEPPRRDPARREPARREPAQREPDRRDPARREPAVRSGAGRLTELVGEVRLRDAQTDRSWQELAAYGSRRRRLLAELRGRREPGGGGEGGERVDLSDLAKVLLRIEDKLEALVEIEQAEATADAAEQEAPQPVAAMPAAAGGEAVAEPAPQAAAPAAAPTAHATNGGEPPAASSPPKSGVKVRDLPDEELERRVERLDQAIGAIRTVLIARYARAEKELFELLPKPQPEPREKPKRPRGDGPGRPKPRQEDPPRPRQEDPRERPRRRPRADDPPAPGPPPLPRPLPQRPRSKPTTLSPAEVRRLQKGLNRFTERYLDGVGPIVVDGIKGHATARRIVSVKYHLGYTGKAQRSATVKPEFVRRMRHPRSARRSTPAMLTRAVARRAKQRKAARASAAPRNGVATFDGRPVAAWLKPYLDWARQNGWKGTLNSGFRDPAYSEKLCMSMCGAPSCPGKCAGRASNHAGSSNPAGAVDVSDYVTFGQLMRRCPYSPRIFNALGAQDPVHFSASGR
jgi:peptidoglycan hydrolase-like protein with peptidoglycan-binding domain